MCEVLAGHVGAEGVRSDARPQCQRDVGTRLHPEGAQAVQGRTGRSCVCTYIYIIYILLL